ncbi:MAG TPA: hypothetical protein VD769_00380 [Gaiellaceae bacterium]|nr:hypothetical protein [Gaiellaceae bacterium]
MAQERGTTVITGTPLDPEELRLGEEASDCCGGGRVWLALPLGAALAGFLAAFLRHRRS